MNIGEKCRRKMWAQASIKKSMVAPMKWANTQFQSRKEDIRETSIVQLLNRPRQIQSKISRCLNIDVEEGDIQIAEELLVISG